jgi:hypothetical protein
MLPEKITELREKAYGHLCWRDQRSPSYVQQEEDLEDVPTPRQNGCGCDPCFYGRDAMALVMLELIDRIANPWVEITESEKPRPGVQCVYWHRSDQPFMSGYPMVADEYSEAHHGTFASHFIPNSHKDPNEP